MYSEENDNEKNYWSPTTHTLILVTCLIMFATLVFFAREKNINVWQKTKVDHTQELALKKIKH